MVQWRTHNLGNTYHGTEKKVNSPFETIASDEEKKTKMSGYEVYFETDLFLM